MAIFYTKKDKKVAASDMETVNEKIGVPEKRKLFGERRNDGMNELMTFI